MKKSGPTRLTAAATPGSAPGSAALPGAGPPQVPDHELLRRIGQGSYGEVWLARNVMGTYRAVKVVYRKSFEEERPFDREFNGIKKFEPISRTHPGFVSILHIGRNERAGYFYYVMEVVDDAKAAASNQCSVISNRSAMPHAASAPAVSPITDLLITDYCPRTLASDLKDRGRLPPGECIQIGLALTAALAHLHRHGLIHRDIKPSNIIFVNGAPKFADIGLVTDIGEAATFVGTEGYLPPEGPGSPTADIFSLGKVLYQVATGKPLRQYPDLPTDLRERGDASQLIRLNAIILKACENDARNRHQSAAEMHKALSECKHDSPARLTLPRGSAAETQVPAPPGVSARVAGERKQVTMLFTNISISEEADPEEVQGFMERCFNVTREKIQRYEGTITHFLSDGITAVFGAPVAHEDHAQRGVLAALAIQQALDGIREDVKRSQRIEFGIRSGLNTGLTVVGVARDSLQYTAMGDTVNLASKILGIAEPGQVLISEETCKATKDYFVTHPLGERMLPGKTEPVGVYHVIRASEARTRLDAGAQKGLTPFVGRARELALLQERFAAARDGRGQIILLAGEAGVGKSRLLLEFRRSLGAASVTWLAGRSISFGKQIAYLPIVDLLKQYFRIEEADAEATMVGRIETRLAAFGDDLRFAVPLLKYLLSLNLVAESERKMDAQERRAQTFEALRRLLLKEAQDRPLVLVVEDLHWMDKTSEDFLVSLADSLTMARIFLLLNYRPGYPNPFPERSYISRVMLQQLTDEESVEMASKVLAGAEFPAELRGLLSAKADGNPFFVEELIKSLIETGALQEQNGRYQATEKLSGIHVPDTVQDVIMGRIDRLEAAPRTALQLASVIGREFPVRLLETISDSQEPLVQSIQKLKNLELIYERSIFPEHTCIFKHALTQDVAYQSLLIQRRKELHCLVAAAIEELYASRLPEFYGLLAYHYERGEEWERALDYLVQTAESSHRVASYREEAALLGQAMAIAARLGQTALAAELRARRGTAYARVGMWAEARPDLEAVLGELSPERVEQRAELLLDLAGVCFWGAANQTPGLDIPGMRRHAAEGLALAEQVGRHDLVAGMMGWLALAEQSAGDLASATDLFERALARGGGFRGASLNNYPLTLYLRGHIAEAVARGRESAQMCRSVTDTLAATFGLPHLALALAASGQYDEAMRVFEEAREMGRKYEVWPFHARAITMSAGFHLDLFDFTGNEAIAQEARERANAAGFQPAVVSAGLDLAFNFARRHEIGRAETLLAETAEAMVKVGGWHRWLWEIRLAQARAEVALALQDWPAAVRWAEDAIAQCRARGRMKYEVAGLETRAKAWKELNRTHEAVVELRTAIDLARRMGDPAMFLRVSSTLLAIEGDDLLLSEARAAAQRILAALPDEGMRRSFLAAEPVRRLGRLELGLLNAQ